MDPESIIQLLETNCSSPRQIASLRRKFLDGHDGLPSLLVPITQESVETFLDFIQKAEVDSTLRISTDAASRYLCRLLELQSQLMQNDAILGEEIQRAQSQHVLFQLIQYDVTRLESLEQQEDVMEVQDRACQIVTKRHSSLPFTVDELKARLPVLIDVTPARPGKTVRILIHQVTARQSAQEDVGFVLWPSALVLSRWLVTEPSVLVGKKVLELGAGCGLTGLVAACLQQRDPTEYESVILTDFNATVLQNLQRNIALNDLSLNCSAVGLDFYQTQNGESWEDMKGNFHDRVDVILAADIICQAEDAVASAQTIHGVLVPGGKAYVVCADAMHRFGVGAFETACKNVGLHVEKRDVKSLYSGELLKSGLDVTSGYVDDMSLTMYFISKQPRLDLLCNRLDRV